MQKNKRNVYIVDGARTPFIKALGKANPLSASDLAVAAAAPLLARQSFKPTDIDEVIAGCVGPAVEEANIARIIALRLGCGEKVTGWTVQRNCASGLQALECAALNIAHGRSELVLAGGTECMSRSPLLYQNDMAAWLSVFQTQKGIAKKLKNWLKFRPHFLIPVVSLLKGLTDPVVNLTMGQTAENVAYQFGISRAEMDAYAALSHQKAIAAHKNGHLDERIALFDWRGNVITQDTGVREDSTLEKLGTLKPVFDKPFGSVTAGNSSQITDGAAFLILASEAAVKQYQLPVLGKIVDTVWSGLDPAAMGLGPVHAIQKLLALHQFSTDDIDYWEINEAFAAQVIACLKAFEDEQFMRKHFNVPGAMGRIPMENVNVDGGAISIGHPVGASGARIVLHLLQVLKRNQAKRGVASLCIGGGQGGAMLIEHVSEIV